MQLLGETNIDFIKWRKVAFIISIIAIVVGLSSIALKGGLGLGLDFTGGMETHLKFENSFEIGRIRSALSGVGLGGAVIQRYGPQEENTVLIRYHLEEISDVIATNIIDYRQSKGEFQSIEELKNIPGIEGIGYENLITELTLDIERIDKINLNKATKDALASVIQDVTSREMASKIQEAIQTEFVNKENPFEILSVSLMGPKVSEELQRNALLAIAFSLIGMLIYIGWRFEFRFAAGAVIALAHDVVIAVGLLSLFNFEFTLPIVAAILTIIGYSLNDTIVVYDRIRENIKTLRKKKLPSKKILNLSINQSLSRTLITSLTTFIVVLILFLWGGEPLRGFTFALLVGVIVGTYSSSFVATPVIYAWGKTKK
ncbi:protein translocase subunit SecF [Candidatus Aerophobetes bacterium]|nr:protein translocase subunit SecF [Candidatus Aerophobetes bacterium]